MDTIILSGIEVYAFGGVTQEERTTGQRYRIRLEMSLDLRAAARSDALNDTVSYAEAHDVAVAAIRSRPFNLLESAAVTIADRLLETFRIQSVTVELQKLLPPIEGVVAYAAVRITREAKT